ncbi:MAG: hypothetical protein AAGD01_13985 [Acidobacteriota bacterium]
MGLATATALMTPFMGSLLMSRNLGAVVMTQLPNADMAMPDVHPVRKLKSQREECHYDRQPTLSFGLSRYP